MKELSCSVTLCRSHVIKSTVIWATSTTSATPLEWRNLRVFILNFPFWELLSAPHMWKLVSNWNESSFTWTQHDRKHNTFWHANEPFRKDLRMHSNWQLLQDGSKSEHLCNLQLQTCMAFKMMPSRAVSPWTLHLTLKHYLHQHPPTCWAVQPDC
jgi:hypothetical protein